MAYIVKGLSPLDDGFGNARILQEAVDRGGDILVEDPGYYKLAETIYIGDHTHITFADGVYFVRAAAKAVNGNAFVNRGAFTLETNVDISITGLHLNVNGIDYDEPRPDRDTGKTILGLRAHVAFLYVRDLVLRDIVIPDLGKGSYGIQISDFENVLVENIRMEGDKDGIHFGPGRNFTLRHAVFRTHDDPVALNAFDYSVSNPNPGWIEDGLIEDCYDLGDDTDVGMCFFARMLCGGWKEWYEGMVVQHSDAVVYDGKLYRVVMSPDFKTYVSKTPPAHDKGFAVNDGITWLKTARDICFSSGCRNITFRDIYIQRNRAAAFGFTQEKSEYCRSYYPGAPSPLQENITFENVQVMGDVRMFAYINAPVDRVTMKNCTLKDAKIVFEPLDEEGLVYPAAEIRMENTAAPADILQTAGQSPHRGTLKITR